LSQLGKKVTSDLAGVEDVPDFGIPVRTTLNVGMRADHLTIRLPGKGGRDPCVQVGKASFAYVVVYYNLRRRELHPKGKHRMVPPRVKDIPVWQALIELEAGDATLPDQYRITQISDSKESVRGPSEGTCLCGCGTILGEKSGRKCVNDGHRKRANCKQIKQVSGVLTGGNRLPACAPSAAVDAAGAWLKTVWARHRKYPGCPVVFDPEMLSLMLGKPRSYVLAGWQWLEEYGYVEAVWEKDSKGELREFFTPGKRPIADPEAHDRALRELAAAWAEEHIKTIETTGPDDPRKGRQARTDFFRDS
jgi:hypothetical protein